MTDFVLINSPIQKYTTDYRPDYKTTAPLGLGYLGTITRNAGIETVLIDADATTVMEYNNSQQEAANTFSSFKMHHKSDVVADLSASAVINISIPANSFPAFSFYNP